MIFRAGSLGCLLLAGSLRFVAAAELMVVVESPPFPLDTRTYVTLAPATLVVGAESSAFIIDTRLVPISASSTLVVRTESPSFALDTRLSGANPIPETLVVKVESGLFALDTRLATAGVSLASLVVTLESGTFALDTRLAGRREDLIVRFESPAFEVNTMWIGIRKISRALNSPLELFWPTNAASFPFHPQGAPAPLHPPLIWQNLPGAGIESDGFFRVPLDPGSSNRYFRLKL